MKHEELMAKLCDAGLDPIYNFSNEICSYYYCQNASQTGTLYWQIYTRKHIPDPDVQHAEYFGKHGWHEIETAEQAIEFLSPKKGNLVKK